jgi:hypothetical protein
VVLLLMLGSTTGTSQKDTAKIGMYLTNLYDFNIADGSYVAEFWTWALFGNDSLDFAESQEVTNSKKTFFTNSDKEKKKGLNWAQKKCTTTVLHDWDVRNFPFDRQKLTLTVEEVFKDTTEMVYIADRLNSKVNANLDLDEWDIDKFIVNEKVTAYNTTYGDPELSGNSSYPAFSAEIFLTRKHSWTAFWKLATGVYVAFFISILVFWIYPPDLETRIGLAVGGLFAAVGNKYIVESVVPSTTQTTLIDAIHMCTFGAILLIVLMTVYLSRLQHNGNEKLSFKLERITSYSILGLYVILNVFFVWKALIAKG